jgi:4-hydroxythreonine-4-phosphate dehydrogenase
VSKTIPRLALTPGEPAGIGPDICVRIAQQALPIELVVIADKELLTRRANLLGLPLQLKDFDPSAEKNLHQPGSLQIINEMLISSAEPGELNKTNARYVLNTLDQAIDGCLCGLFDAMVTGPIHKGIINEAHITSAKVFTGHTEYLAECTGGNLPVMMLATSGLRVALVTTHLPLSRVSENITTESLTRVIEILHQELINRFSIETPTILVCGLNPHAGEDGHLGKEEIEIIIPVLKKLRERGWQLTGPLPADTLFVPDRLKQADAVLAMYHDQGLPVLKHMGFGQAINITLGLPIIRTSVDHGVALDLAGTGKANISSLKLAIDAAAEMVKLTNLNLTKP